MTSEDLQRYSDAWNAHDIEAIMGFHTADSVFETGGGSESYGTRFAGFEEVRQRFIAVWTDIPDVHFQSLMHAVQGDSGCSEWTFTGTAVDGSKIEIDGCDLFTFEQGRISSKRSYLKNRAG